MPGSASIRDCTVLETMMKKHVVDGGLFAAICAAPAVVLGSWGLLAGLRVRFKSLFFLMLCSFIVIGL